METKTENLMKTNAEQLAKMDLEDFYTCSVSESGITMQGKYSAFKVKKYSALGYTFSPDGINGFIVASFGNTCITLTD